MTIVSIMGGMNKRLAPHVLPRGPINRHSGRRPQPKAPRSWTIYLVRLDHEPAYVGQTCQQLNDRLRGHKRHSRDQKRSTHWTSVLDAAVARNARITIEPLATANTEAEAVRVEDEYTAHLFAAGYQLANRNVRGKYAASSRAAISATTKRQEYPGGQPGIRKVPLFNVETGETFPSVHAAARALNVRQSSVSLALKRGGRVGGVFLARKKAA